MELAPTAEEAFPKMWGLKAHRPLFLHSPTFQCIPPSKVSLHLSRFPPPLAEAFGHFTATALSQPSWTLLAFEDWFLWVGWNAYHPGGDVWQTSHIRFN